MIIILAIVNPLDYYIYTMTTTQTKATHTAGPWTLTKNLSRLEVRISKTESYAFSHKDEANARLIASAPELLEALETLLKQTSKLDQSATHDGLENCKAIAQARNAINKATL